MQLAIMTFVVLFLMSIEHAKAQIFKFRVGDKGLTDKMDTTEQAQEVYLRPDWKKIDVNILNSYYAQDGNNGAVTGGIGTEQLTDFTQKLTVDFPTSKKLRWNIDTAYDYYSSASTDNIDNVQSSDSSSDIRTQFSIGLQKTNNATTTSGIRIGTSVEYDYTSVNGGLNYSKSSNSGNTRVDLNAQAFYDKWYVILPRELKGKLEIPSDKRQSYNLAIGVSQVLNKKMQLALMAEATYMKGLLSTPFHRTYFQDQQLPGIETLPGERLKIPIGLRWNSHLTERLIMRTYYRYYWDSWGMQGHTASIELPIKINRFFAVYPHYRYHTQSAIDYFKPYKEHLTSDQYYSSDYDLSALQSHTYGLGIIYSKAEGLARIKLPFKNRSSLVIEAIDLKYAHYDRSTGLTGDIISLGLKISF